MAKNSELERLAKLYHTPSICETSGDGYDRYTIVDSLGVTMEHLRDTFGGRRKVHPIKAFETSVEVHIDCGMNAYDGENEEVVMATVRDLAELGLNEDELPQRAVRAWPVTEHILVQGLHQAVLLNSPYSRLFPDLNPMTPESLQLHRRSYGHRAEKAFGDRFPRIGEYLAKRAVARFGDVEAISLRPIMRSEPS
jgi:hypothetical protein